MFSLTRRSIWRGDRGPQSQNLLQILAEPNLIAVNGKEASFLAGGEFPFPVAQQNASGIATVTIQFASLACA